MNIIKNDVANIITIAKWFKSKGYSLQQLTIVNLYLATEGLGFTKVNYVHELPYELLEKVRVVYNDL